MSVLLYRWPPLLKGVDRFWDETKGEEEEIDEEGPVKISRRRGSSIHRGRVSLSVCVLEVTLSDGFSPIWCLNSCAQLYQPVIV